MKWLVKIARIITTAVSKIKINKFVKAGLAISILLIIRKATMNKVSSNEVNKLIL
jgi:hypothetical protein